MKFFLIYFIIICLKCTSGLNKENSKYFISVIGKVSGGNFTYCTVVNKGPISLYLVSRTGDADLYVSQVLSQPSYEPENYCLHSATCGLDVVHVPKSFKRPLWIGIFGYPFHEESDYILRIESRTEDIGEDSENFNPYFKDEESDQFIGRELPGEELEEEYFERPYFLFLFMTNKMLQFENQMLLDVLNGDSLLVAAKGLSIETVILNLVKVYCDPGNLVIVLGATNAEEDYIISELEKDGVIPLPRVITSEVPNNDREKIYLGGGVMFVSSRILVVDFLKKRIPVASITGFVIMRAHLILDSCQQAFALRLYRQGNNTGFIIGFSRSPHALTVGLMKLERTMKALFATNLYLWPRFHATVSSSLQGRQPAVIELHISLSPAMTSIQNAVLDLVHFCTREIKRINPILETEEITVENALSKTFHKRLQLQLDPIWHQLSGKTKQIVADLRTLRIVLNHLTQSDCVRLYSCLMTLRTKEYMQKNSGWMLLDSAETLFVTAKSRLFDSKQNFEPEHNPKWETLNEVLTEIQRDESVKGPKSVLILVEEKSTAFQLKQLLTMGAKEMLSLWYHRLFSNEVTKGTEQAETVKEEEDVGETIILTQKLEDAVDCNSTFTEMTAGEEFVNEPRIVIQPFKKKDDALSLAKALKQLQPYSIIMYDVDVSAVRQIEVYQATAAVHQIKVYFLIYGNSVEEQAYLTTLRREKEAFENLIKEKSVIVVEDIKAAGGLARESINDRQPADTRKGGLPARKQNPKVIVDMREFRSELPSLIHKQGIDVEPVTLQIGDYILTPEVCVERKSISDLIGSLNSGRLYTQALAMTRYYTKAILLIEFDENKPFVLQGRYYVSSDMSSSDIRAKLQLLTLHFPKLRLVWSPSPFASAQLFLELKDGREEPNATIAASIGEEDGGNLEDDRVQKFNSSIQDFIIKLPGISTKNVRGILEKGKSLDHLIMLTVKELEESLGSQQNAELLYNSLHKSTRLDSQTSNFRAKAKPRGVPGKRRVMEIK